VLADDTNPDMSDRFPVPPPDPALVKDTDAGERERELDRNGSADTGGNISYAR